jgi:hypothetical protein
MVGQHKKERWVNMGRNLQLIPLICKVNNFDVFRYKNKFERNKKEFEQLVNLLNAQNIQVGYLINQNELPDEIQECLNNLDITDLNLNHTNCEGLIKFEFTTSWCSTAHLYIAKDSCDMEHTKKGYHRETNSSLIEIWGLGDGWFMWIDHDFI